MKKQLFFLIITLLCSFSLYSQDRKEMTIEDVINWSRITDRQLSANGSFIAVQKEAWRGSSSVLLFDNKGNKLFEMDSSFTPKFSRNSDCLFFYIGEKKNGSYAIYDIKGRVFNNFDKKVKSIIELKESSDILTLTKDSIIYTGSIKNPMHNRIAKFLQYDINETNTHMVVNTNDALLIYSFKDSHTDTLVLDREKYDKLVLSPDAKYLSFISNDSLFLFSIPQRELLLVSGRVSKRSSLSFSPSSTKLYFSNIRDEYKKDNQLSKDDFPNVHIWHWRERVQFSEQVVSKNRDRNRGDFAVFNIEAKSLYKSENRELDYKLIDKGNSDLVVALDYNRYGLEKMWEGRDRCDLYLVNTLLGRSMLIEQNITGSINISPAGKFLYWYNRADSSWYSYTLEGNRINRLTDPRTFAAYDQDDDRPDLAYSYSIAGWSKDDSYILINDKYDVFKFDPNGVEKPINLTKDGRSQSISYRYIKLDSKEEYIDLDSNILLEGFNHLSKGNSYYILNRRGDLKRVYGGDFKLSNIVRSSDGSAYIFSQESFEQFPDILYSDSNFKKVVRVTDINPQQKEFNWGTAELIKWISLDGIELEGVIYKPQNFDPTKKYPMIVNFYERNSDNLYSYRQPEPHRSTIDYHWYTSNGYIVFNPDIAYKEGYPGESAYNAIMPGISIIISKGYVDSKRIGAQGHSWGGYQVAYLATRTDIFAAIESGAPVVNMFSAYGGIRWGTGKNRSFQYEHQQSRIAGTPWQYHMRYIENSPLFSMDKVNTPILIMHNDKDGHVPWEQGIEYFIALKRLQKPVWLLNYTGEIHWPQKMENKIDFQIRMKQFFDHYLNNQPMPRWMIEPIDALELETNLGY